MPNDPCPHNVFLDTAVFIETNFSYASPKIRSLISLAAAEIIQIFLTDITAREIRANLKELVKRAVRIRPEPILRNSNLPGVKSLFRTIDGAVVEKELVLQFEQFLKDANVTILPIEGAALHDVLDASPATPSPASLAYLDELVMGDRPVFLTYESRNEKQDASALGAFDHVLLARFRGVSLL